MQDKETPESKSWLRACVNFRAGNRMPSCGARGSREIVTALETGLLRRNLDWRLEKVHCMGKCHLGPTMRILPNGPFVMGIQKEDVPRVLELLEQGKINELAAAFPLPRKND